MAIFRPKPAINYIFSTSANIFLIKYRVASIVLDMTILISDQDIEFKAPKKVRLCPKCKVAPGHRV